MNNKPLESNLPRSPLCNHPSSSLVSFVFSGSFKYPIKICRPYIQISPSPVSLGLSNFVRKPGKTEPTLPNLCKYKNNLCFI